MASPEEIRTNVEHTVKEVALQPSPDRNASSQVRCARMSFGYFEVNERKRLWSPAKRARAASSKPTRLPARTDITL